MGITDLAKVLVDTSIWIEFFRKNEPYYSMVNRLMDDERVICCGVVLAELMQGVKSERELAVLDSFPQVFNFIAETPELWADAGKLSFKLRRQGATIGLSDCFIAVAAASVNAQVATLDSHFKILRELADISLLPLN